MAKRDHHRKPRFLRAAAILAWALQGLLTPWMQTPAYAANPDTIQLGVRPYSSASPAAVSDLLASPNPSIVGQVSLTWTAPEGNAGGTPIANLTVARYSVHYATFSVDSLLGDTTAWWNSTLSSSITLQSPGYTPQPPGALESYTFTGLAPYTTFYFAVRSDSPFGIISSIDVNAAAPTQQAQAYTAVTLSPPGSFNGSVLSNSSIQWAWSAVPGATGYQVYSHPANTLLQTVAAPSTSWTETGLTANTAYTRKIRTTDGITSSSDSVTATVYTLANTPTSFVISGFTANSLSLSWNANGNPAGTPYGLERSPDGVAFVVVSTLTATSYLDTGLTLNTSYYYRLRAINGDGVVTAYTPILSGATAASSVAPAIPNGLLSTSSSNGLQVTLTWTPVTLDTSGNPITVDHYLVYRYLTIGDTPTVAGTIHAPAVTYTASTGGGTYFYRIQAVSNFGSVSQLSDYMDSSTDGNRYTLAADDFATRVVIPHEASLYLIAANNPYHEDLEMAVVRQPQDEVNITLKSYKVTVQIARTKMVLPGFVFPNSNVSVQLGYGASIQSLHKSLSPGQQAPITNGSIAQIISVYWYNGSNYVQISNPVLTGGQSIAVNARNVGVYQLRAVTIGTKFRLSQGSPYPRVITPNGSENRRVFWFFENPTGDVVSGTIYDIRGAHVRNIEVNGMSPTANSLVWDGRDDRGAVVPSGVYLYKISTTDGNVTGTVVVAR